MKHVVRFVSVVSMLLGCGCAAGVQVEATTSASQDSDAYPPPGLAPAAAGAVRPASALDEVRDARRSRRMARALPLLVTEIQGLRSLEISTAAMAADRPMLERRLAEDYVELENAARRELVGVERERDAARATDPRQAERLQRIVNERTQIIAGARAGAIRWYARLVNDYSGRPSAPFPQSPPPAYALLDEARYFLAWEYEQAGDFQNARRVDLDLVGTTPNSKYAPLVYLAFGEQYLQESDSDPTRLAQAKMAYEKVVGYPAPANSAYGVAWLRLGQVAEREEDRATALAAYRRADDFARAYPDLPASRVIAPEIPGWVARATADRRASGEADASVPAD